MIPLSNSPSVRFCALLIYEASRPLLRHVFVAVTLLAVPPTAFANEDQWGTEPQAGGEGPGRVAVVVTGKRASSLEADLISELADAGLDVMSAADYQNAARSEGINGRQVTKPAGIRRASAAAAVDRVLHIRLKKKKRRVFMEATLFDADGGRVWGQKTKLKKKGGLNGKQMRRLTASVRKHTPATTAMAASQSGRDEFDGGGADSPAGDGGEPSSPGGGDYGPDGDPGTPSDTGYSDATTEVASAADMSGFLNEPGVERDASAVTQGEREGRPAFLAARLVGGAGMRYYSEQDSKRTINYSSTPYPELGVLLECNPLRSVGWLIEGLGVEASILRSFISSRYKDIEGESAVTDTPVHRIQVDGRYRLALFPDSGWSPVLGARVGYGISDFQVGVSVQHFVGVRHIGLRFGGELQQPIIPSIASLHVVAAYMPSLEVGEEEIKAYGDLVKSIGLGLRAGIVGGGSGGNSGFMWSLYFDALQHQDEFSFPSDAGGAPETAKATERYLAVTAGLGWAF